MSESYTKQDISIRFYEQLSKFSDGFNTIISNDSSKTIAYTPEEDRQIECDKVQPLERYLCTGAELRATCFYESVKVGDVVLIKVSSRKSSVLQGNVICILQGHSKYVDDLKLQVTGVVMNNNNDLDPDEELEVSDFAKAVIISIKRKQIDVSFEDKCLKKDAMHHFPLGKLESEDYLKYKLIIDRFNRYDYNDPSLLLTHLNQDPAFVDPHSVKRLLHKFNIDTKNSTFLSTQNRKSLLFGESIDRLREKQSYKWSMEMTGTGVKHFREKEEDKAMSCFDQAITFFAKNVEAYVARGALKANNNKLKEAVLDFRKALEINPDHKNGKKYLTETLHSIGKGHERDLRWKEASKCYKNILEVDPDHRDAQDGHKKIQLLLSRQILNGKPSSEGSSQQQKMLSSISSKSQAKIDRLKQMLATEVHTTSSSSSSSSDESQEWVERDSKASNKKKRKL